MTTIFKPPKVSEPLIDENNYHSWAKELLRALRTIELEEFITEAHKDTPADKVKEWQKNIDRVINTLLINCEKEPQQLIRGCDTAYEAWELLKKHYEGRTRMHLTSLLLNITTMRLDDRATTINEHIMTFEKRWAILRQTVASATADSTTQAGAIKYFASSDAWKATLLLGTLPKIQLYQNIVDTITAGTADPSYNSIVIKLKELNDRPTARKFKKDEPLEPPSAFATEGTRERKFCGYCKSKGWPGTSHNENECRTKKRDANQRPQTHLTETLTTEEENAWAECFNTEYNQTSTAGYEQTSTTGWWADSCSTVHITNDIRDVPNAQPCLRAVKTGVGVIYSTHIGIATVQGLDLVGILVVPGFPRKIIATGEITSSGGKLVLGKNTGELSYRGVTITLTPVGKLFKVEEGIMTIETAMTTDQEWHERYGHLPFPVFSKIHEAPLSLRISRFECEKCKKAKTVAPPSPPQENKIRTREVGELVHSDLCGPFSNEDLRGNKYIITLIDDHSRFTMASAIKQKSEAASRLQDLITRFEIISGRPIKNIRTDHGGEYRYEETATFVRRLV